MGESAIRKYAELVFHKALGFAQMSCFACSLCDDYVTLFGNPDFSAIA